MTPRKRRMMVGFAALVLAVWFVVTLVLFIVSNVRTDIDLRAGEATADVALGDVRCEKTFSQSFPFFKMACTEVEP